MSESDVNASEAAYSGKLMSRHAMQSTEAKEATMDNLIVWADIPVTDLDRAMKFYSAVLQREFVTMEGMDGVALPAPDDPSAPPSGDMPVAFDLVRREEVTPSHQGCTVYLDSGGDADGMLRRAAEAGGQILSPAAFMGEMVGTIGFFQDSEGNRIGVHQQGGAS